MQNNIFIICSTNEILKKRQKDKQPNFYTNLFGSNFSCFYAQPTDKLIQIQSKILNHRQQIFIENKINLNTINNYNQHLQSIDGNLSAQNSYHFLSQTIFPIDTHPYQLHQIQHQFQHNILSIAPIAIDSQHKKRLSDGLSKSLTSVTNEKNIQYMKSLIKFSQRIETLFSQKSYYKPICLAIKS